MTPTRPTHSITGETRATRPFARLHPSRPPSPPRRGFTLVELLVVILIIVTLAGVVFSVTQNIRRSAAKVTDMNNLRSLATAAMAAGSDNAGRLPQIHDPNSVYPYYLIGRNKLEASGIFKEACYAPTRNIMGGAPDYEWWFRDKSGEVNTPVHYIYFANDAEKETNAWFLKKGTVKKPDKSEYRGDLPYEEAMKIPSKGFARTLTDQPWYSVLWAGICREYGGNTVAAIMKDDKALGVNVIHLDGHAEWVDAKNMKVRYEGGGVKAYW